MPYRIETDRGGCAYAVVVEGTGKVVGCHATRREAEQHLRALYANVPEASKGMWALGDVLITKYSEDQPRDERGRFGSSGNEGDDGAPKYRLVGDQEDGYLRPIPDPGDHGSWGATHSGSYAITGASAEIMNLEGYKYNGDRLTDLIATKFLERIAGGAEQILPGEYVYHGDPNKAGRSYQVGQTLDLPLVATESNRENAAAYGFSWDLFEEDHQGAVLYAFESGTNIMGYSGNTPAQVAEGDGQWAEAITAGRFTVQDVRPGPTYGWKKLPTTEVVLRQTAVFDPTSKRWVGK